MPEVKDKPTVEASTIWQLWAKTRAKEALSIESIHEISKKVNANVTQMVLEDRRGD